MHIKDIMSRNVQTCRSYESLNTAAHKMWEADIGAVPIVDDKDRVVGMVTDRDICMAAYLRGRPLAEIPLVEVMSHELLSCGPDDTLDHAEALMRSRQIRRLPVLDAARHVIGMISLNDIIRAVSRTHHGRRELIETMAAICHPRQQSDHHTPV